MGIPIRCQLRTSRFPSNWELSTARAISVVKSLVAQGILPSNLAATGFGEFQPIDLRNNEIANRLNRRDRIKAYSTLTLLLVRNLNYFHYSSLIHSI